MPVLPLETFIFPDDLLAGNGPENSETGSVWWALHTHPRAEKSLARRLLKRNVSFFLPLYHRQHRTPSGRMVAAFVPLFPGYLFLQGDAHDRLHALETNLIVRALPVVDQQQLHHDLQDIYQLIRSGSGVAPEERLQPGTPVEITSGPLTGMQGKILRRGKHLRFFVEVRLLQQGVSVEIESWMFRPLASLN
jgi:transcription antitermination factor NusG